MSFPCKNQLALAVAMVLTSLSCAAMPMDDLFMQADNLPEGFSDHIFGAPLISRVELDGQYLGDATILLSRAKTVQLANFTETQNSTISSAIRGQWAKALGDAFPLGKCESDCPRDLQSLYYSLSAATLYIVTTAAKEPKGKARTIALPEEGSLGMILRNQMNLAGGELQPWSGYQNLQLESSIGHWTGRASSQISRSDLKESETQARISSLYLQREFPHHAVRTGLFLPDTQGILRQPVMPGRNSQKTLVGAMLSSSDTLLETSASASLYPIYITANRESVAEIYRDGVLINSQPVDTGMQQLDTTVLPPGIYGIEVRLLEDGQEVSRTEETVYKPGHWKNPDRRLNYNLFGGVEKELGNQERDEGENKAALGASANYLLTPRVVLGGAVQRNAQTDQIGASADIQMNDATRFYGSVGTSNDWGARYDAQLNWQFMPQTSLLLNHSQSWYQSEESLCSATNCDFNRQQNSGVTLNHRFSNGDTVSLRGAHSNKQSGLGLDASWRSRFKVKNTPVSVTVNGFDRPYSQYSGKRNRGMNVNFSFSLGESNRAVNASLGSRNDSRGGRDYFASAGVTQRFESGPVKHASVGAIADKYGVGGNVYAEFDHRYASGSVFAQQSTLNQKMSGGMNMNNTLAIGGGKISVSHSPESWASHTGMIVDVESDDPNVKLKAWDNNGMSSTLHAGRNFVPVSAWKSGQIQVDFDGNDAPPMKIWPAELPYHLNKGGVAYNSVRVMSTVTVVGRLVDGKGEPVSGVKLANHAGYGISEHDGFFVTDMHQKNRELTIHHKEGKSCTVKLDNARFKQENGTLMVGDISCNTGAES
ncbi:CS1-pili formation C-terminal domain-containing protein [Scandinavium sp.]|uniref:CS1-pili formation C-terminal domain-containing protein n=1 Tax=Scandinavium sp. TaxID=2830653 RepID=UPI00289C3587|nr:CS1-pili formation C-terminal domain-containing protein [Scandinavium sp.]